MEKHEIQAFEYAVFTFNRLAEQKITGFIPFKIIWDTKFGPATATNVLYNESRSKPIIKEEFFNDEYFYSEESNAYAYTDELYAYVYHTVYNYFGNSFEYSNRFNMAERPHILMNKLLELSKFNKESNLKKPDYLTTWDFKTLDESIQLPFVDDKNLISRPLCLTTE